MKTAISSNEGLPGIGGHDWLGTPDHDWTYDEIALGLHRLHGPETEEFSNSGDIGIKEVLEHRRKIQPQIDAARAKAVAAAANEDEKRGISKGHGIYVGNCGHVISRCRCPNESKVFVDAPCVRCASNLTNRAGIDEPPTAAQKEAGNYKKEHIKHTGLDIAIETKQGDIRSGTSRNGQAWTVAMPADYGYVKRTEGKDGDQLDVYVGSPDEKGVYVIDQVNANTGQFDEHKCMLGFDSSLQALNTYKQAFSDGRGFDRMGAVTYMTPEAFRDWVKEGDLTKPLSDKVSNSAPGTGWYGVDLDGTLALELPGDFNGDIGGPVQPMVDRVKKWLAQGKTVKIFTARVVDDEQVSPIQDWLESIGLPRLEVTNEKDPDMIELWDDRVVQVAKNSGEPVLDNSFTGHAGRPGLRGGSAPSGDDSANEKTNRLAAKWIYRWSWDAKNPVKSMPNIAVDNELQKYVPPTPVTLYRFQRADHDASKTDSTRESVPLQSWSKDKEMVHGIVEMNNEDDASPKLVALEKTFEPHEIYTDFTMLPPAIKGEIDKLGGDSEMQEVLVLTNPPKKIANSFFGHKGVPGQKGGSAPKGEGGGEDKPKSKNKGKATVADILGSKLGLGKAKPEIPVGYVPDKNVDDDFFTEPTAAEPDEKAPEPIKLPDDPEFEDGPHKDSNIAEIETIKKLALAGDLAGIKKYPISKSQKVESYIAKVINKLAGGSSKKSSPPPSKWKSSGGVVYNDEGKIAIIAPKGKFGGYEWTFPKGTIEKDETKEAAAHREVEEESGLKGEIQHDLGEHEGNSSFTNYFLMKHTGSGGKQDGETAQVKWVTPEEASTHLHSVRDLRVLVKAMVKLHQMGVLKSDQPK